ncbi:site-specific DNA-methyltransferase [Tenacibaculum aquimarinum]|uniref:site-specific DNA-methyltransferase n=1 Tax=Tenacibaculum aquimarinum TaxID=2910675 RepID=UPI001F0A4EE5|nr:site-specific DNA-methyltransferase [Tenacibaculum aquimarinum]MCH3883493.1 site-specific DNA-methyltransferase [Tenacibaculum aquimarinum]
MPTLNWIGKEKVINHHQDVPFKILEPQYTFTNEKETKGVTSENKIIHGDNLEALKSLLPEYEGKIKCIYIDPPYNTGNEGWVYNDNVSHPKLKKWLGQVVGKESEDLSRHDKWLCMMYPRLKLLHKLLADDGAIFISIDDNEQANLQLMCNEIFGLRNYIGRFIWKKKKQPSFLAKHIANVTEYVFVYSKHSNLVKKLSIENVSDETRRVDNAANDISERIIKKGILVKKNIELIPAGKYKIKTMELEFLEDVKVKNNRTLNKFKVLGQFRNKQEDIDIFCDEDLLFITTNGGFRRLPTEKEKTKKKTVVDLLQDWGDNQDSDKELSLLFGKKPFDYPKPSKLISNLIKSITYDKKDSIVLDSFAGSGTTAHAVLNLNKQDGGNRKFILVEMEDYANTITAERVKRVINGYGEDKKAVEGTGGDFTYYELGDSLFLDNGFLNESIGLDKIHQYVWYSETKEPYKKEEENYLLGAKNDTAYYFYYNKDSITTLDESFLRSIKTKANQYIIYADNCLLPQTIIDKYNIVFKKIPRDITRF